MSWTHISDTTPKARKVHWCELCALRIEIGQTYVKRCGLADGDFVCSLMHVECEAATKQWDETDWMYRCSPDEFRQMLARMKAVPS